MKVLLKGYYGFGNFGDDLLMLISYTIIKEKYPDSNITIFSNYTTNLKGFNRSQEYNNYIYKVLGEELPLIDWTYRGYFDLVIEGGGGTYFDSTPRGFIYYLRNIVVSNVGNLFLKRVDNFLRRLTKRESKLTYGKRVAMGIGIGPFNKSSRNFYTKLVDLASLDFLMTRDKFSYSFAKKFNPTGKIELGSDLAFYAKNWEAIFGQRNKNHKRKTIGFILKGGKKSFVKQINRAAQLFKNEDWEVHFFAFDENVDFEFIEECQKHYKVEIWKPHEVLLNEYISKLQKCTILITERAHGAIVGAIIGRVPYFVSSSYKTNQILSFFQNTNNKFDMFFDKNIDSKGVGLMWEEVSEREKSIGMDSKYNHESVTNSVNFAFR